MTKVTGFFVTLALSAGIPAVAGDCPSVVVAAIGKAHSGAKVMACKQETEDGAILYDVTIRTEDGKKLAMDVRPDGAILVTEEPIDIAKLPAAVVATLHGEFADAKVKEAARLTYAEGDISYEIVFTSGDVEKEITVTAAGVLVELETEEDDDADPDEDD